MRIASKRHGEGGAVLVVDRSQDKAAAEPQQAVAVPDNWRWPSSAPASTAPVEADRGELYGENHNLGENEVYRQTDTSPAWPAQQYLSDHATPSTLSVEQAAPPRRGFLAALFGGGAAAVASVPAMAEQQAAPPSTWAWPEPAGEQYRGELHEPQPLAIEQEWQWPDALPGAAMDSPQIEYQPEFWDAPALPAPDGYAMGWDAQEAEDVRPSSSYEALPVPEPEVPRLSSQAEIDRFMEVARDTTPGKEPELTTDYNALALPPPGK